MITHRLYHDKLAIAALEIQDVISWLGSCDDDEMTEADTEIQEIEYVRGYLSALASALNEIRNSFSTDPYTPSSPAGSSNRPSEAMAPTKEETAP